MGQLPADQGIIQAAIEDHLDAIGKTRYRLAKDCDLAPGRIYRILRRPTTSTVLERLLCALGAKLVLGGFVYDFAEVADQWEQTPNIKAGRRHKERKT